MTQPDPALAEWSLLKKLLVCFFFIFFVLYIFLNPNEVIPYSFYLHKIYIEPSNRLIVWLATDVFHFVNPAVKFYNGTVDTVFAYLAVLFIAFIAIAGSILWVRIGGNAIDYRRIYNTLIIILRYFMAITWIAYGSIKIIKLQFPDISPVMLLKTYGDSTPKELAWAFMGYSTGFNYFIGFVEYAVGLLLFFRRTSTLGNIIGVGILANVVAFNYSFDDNIKLLSTILLLMTLFLLSKDLKRLTDFFWGKKIIHPMDEQPAYFKEKWKNTTLLTAKIAFILYLIFFDLHGDVARARQTEANIIKSPLYGIYNVTVFIRNKDILNPLTTDTIRWKKLIIAAPGDNAAIMLMNDSVKRFALKTDIRAKKMELIYKTAPFDKYTFIYNGLKNGALLLHGKYRADSLEVQLQRYDINKLPLINSRFRWVLDHNFK